MLDFEVLPSELSKSYAENEALRKRKDDILSYLITRAGILSGIMERYSFLGERIVAWITGEKPLLIIGGEPASGKSLLMGELALRLSELRELYPGLQSPPILISYDQVHYLFLKQLLDASDESNFLPEGETHPEARKLISAILQDILNYALCDYRPKNTPIIFEAPLMGYRGEDVVKNSRWKGMQILITYSPAMQSRILQQEQQQVRKVSAQPLAIRQIHKVLLEERAIVSLTQQEQDNELIKSWERWLDNREGLVLTWDPADDEVGFTSIKETLKEKCIPSDPLAPPAINAYAIDCIEARLKEIPDLKGFARQVNDYGQIIMARR